MILSSCKMRLPDLAKSGIYWVTSLIYVQIMPSPRVGSGVEVRQTSVGLVTGA